MGLVITTNHHHRPFKYRYQVPKKVLEWYSWLDQDDSLDGWISYRGHWMHSSDFMHLAPSDPASPFRGWDGYHGDSYFSGTVIRLHESGETYQIGTYMQTSS